MDGDGEIGSPTFADSLNAAISQWCRDLERLADTSGLYDLATIDEESIDLTRAHPSGVAQLHAGHSTPLNNLIREPTALAALRNRARKLQADSQDYALRYGLPSTQLAIATATWSENDAHSQERIVRTVPVLLRPVTMRRRGASDQEIVLSLQPSVEINPVLVATLRGLGVQLDPHTLADECFAGAGFNPNGTLMRLRDLGQSVIADFRLSERLVIGCFVRPGQALVDDVVANADVLARHPVIRALTGDAAVANALRAVDLPPETGRDPAPWDERGIGDLEPSQHRVIQTVATGASVFVSAAGSARVAATVAAIMADAAASGRSVLYVPGHQPAGEAVFAALQAEGLEDLALDIQPTAGWAEQAAASLVEAAGLTVAPPDADALGAGQSALAERSSQLDAYVTSLHQQREPWGVSAHDALQALAGLSMAEPPPRTTARLGAQACLELNDERRAESVWQLQRLAELGEFDASFETPWRDAAAESEQEAAEVIAAIGEVRDALPLMRARLSEACEYSMIDQPSNVAACGEVLSMFESVRTALDTFKPEVFERSATDMIDALASQQWRRDRGIETPAAMRRMLKRQARDLLRPGRTVSDMHEALIEAEECRLIWLQWSPRGPWPKVPANLSDLSRAFAELREPLARVEIAVGPDPDGTTLATMPFDQLVGRVDRLFDARSDLAALPERAQMLGALDAAGLMPLVVELRSRLTGTARRDGSLSGDLLAAEVDLAWWLSVFESILVADPFLASCNGRSLQALLADFERLDVEHVASLPGLTGASAAHWIRQALDEHPAELGELMTQAAQRPVSLAQLRSRAPHAAARLRPCWLVSPLQLPRAVPGEIAGKCPADLVIIDAVQTTPLAQVVPAIARGSQIVVFGNERRALAGGAAAALAEVLPTIELRASGGRRDPALSRFLIEFGGERLQPPWPLPRIEQLTTLRLVPGSGMLAQGAEAIETTAVEVDAVVGLVAEHVRVRPDESLAVVALSRRHAARLRDAIQAAANRNLALASALSDQRLEQLVVADLTGLDGLARDAVILSVGFAKTPHGRLLHSFGMVDEPDGEPLLLGALAAVRHRLTVVSCFDVTDLDADRLQSDGARLLGAVLEFAGQSHPIVPQSVDRPDMLLADLARRLGRRGLTVAPQYGLLAGEPIPLAVGRPEYPDDLIVAVLTDDESYLAEPSNRVRVRLRARELRWLGWEVFMAWSIAAFLDPEELVDAIEELVDSVAPARHAASGGPTGTGARGHVGARGRVAGEPVLPERGSADEDAAWGDRPDSENWQESERPPHWRE